MLSLVFHVIDLTFRAHVPSWRRGVHLFLFLNILPGCSWSVKFCHSRHVPLNNNNVKKQSCTKWCLPWGSSQSCLKYSVTSVQILCSCLFCSIQRALLCLIKRDAVFEEPSNCCLFSVCWHSWFLYFTICQISGRIDRESLFFCRQINATGILDMHLCDGSLQVTPLFHAR